MATTKKPEEWIARGFKRDPAKFPVIFVPIPEQSARLVENDATYRAALHQIRGTGKGKSALLYATPQEIDKLLELFGELVTAGNEWAKPAIRRLKTFPAQWGGPIERIAATGYPVRAAVVPGVAEKPAAVDKPETTKPRKATANPRTAARKMVNRVVKRAQETQAIRKPATKTTPA